MNLLELDPAWLKPSLPPDTAATFRRRWWMVLLALWLLTSLYIVRADQQAVVTRFGRVVEPRVTPGIHLSLPWPLDRVTRLKVQQRQRQVIGGTDTRENAINWTNHSS